MLGVFQRDVDAASVETHDPAHAYLFMIWKADQHLHCELYHRFVYQQCS